VEDRRLCRRLRRYKVQGTVERDGCRPSQEVGHPLFHLHPRCRELGTAEADAEWEPLPAEALRSWRHPLRCKVPDTAEAVVSARWGVEARRSCHRHHRFKAQVTGALDGWVRSREEACRWFHRRHPCRGQARAVEQEVGEAGEVLDRRLVTASCRLRRPCKVRAMAWATEETDEVLAPWPGPVRKSYRRPRQCRSLEMVEAAVDSGHWAAEAA
jgi:hypothetical protein